MKLLIVADDLGISRERNRGILESMVNGIVTHTCIMVNCNSSKDAVELLGNNNLLDRVGLHLNLTEGSPISSRCKSLLNSSNRFYGKTEFRNKCYQNTFIEKEIENEITAQIEWFIEHIGYVPKFINGHQHIQCILQIADILANIISKYKISYIRIPYESDLEFDYEFKNNIKQTIEIKELCKVCSIVSKESYENKNKYIDRGINTNDYFIGLSFCTKLYTQKEMELYIEHFLNNKIYENKTIEIMVHPGYKEIDNKGWDKFSESLDRDMERKVLCNLIKYKNKI